MKKIRSRIHEFIDNGLMLELDKICRNVVVTDNNIKAATIKETLDKHGVYYNELGPGTNRMAVLIDGYVFKIAMDKWGKQDNANEFTMSKELQPFVIKVYENNDLISVSEYVTLISREEFIEKKNEILKILSILSESYLLGDVGYVTKNFTNWGYRNDGSLVILDFAYIHNIQGEEMFCPNDSSMLEYDMNFHKLRCPKCSKQFSFSDIRRKIPIEEEWAYINEVKNHSYQLTTSSIIIKEESEQSNKINKKEEVQMPDKEFTEEVITDGYKSALDRLRKGLLTEEVEPVIEEEIETVEEPVVIETDEDDGFGSAVELMRRLNNPESSEEETDEDEDLEEEESEEVEIEDDEEITLNIQQAIVVSNNNTPDEEEEEFEVVKQDEEEFVMDPEDQDLINSEEETETEIEIEVQGQEVVEIEIETEVQPEEVSEPEEEEFDFYAIADSITEEDEASSEVITRSTPVTGVSILTGNSEVDVVVSNDNNNKAKIVVSTELEEKPESKIKMIKVYKPENDKPVEETKVEEPTKIKPDLLAQAYNQRMNNFRSTIRLTRPEDNDVEETEPIETEQEKYERLARESGFYED